MSRKNIEMLAHSATESLLFLETFVTDTKISESIRKSLKIELELFKQRESLGSSGIISPSLYLMNAESSVSVAFRLGRLEVLLAQELPTYEIAKAKEFLIAVDILICYMNVKTVLNF